jgi:predicted deacylase
VIDIPPPIELTPPDLDEHRKGNMGVEYVTTLEGGAPGPHAVITALIHGNELCGAVALDFLLRARFTPRRGRLTLVFANVAAFRTFDPSNPSLSRFLDEDMNRVWSPEVLDGPRTSIELARAREIRPVVEAADFLLDLHSMQYPGEPLTLCGRTKRGRALARALGFPGWVVSDGGHEGGRRLIDHPVFSSPSGAPTALLVECGQHWEAVAALNAIEAVLRFLLHLGMADEAFATPHLGAPARGGQRFVEVTHVVTALTDHFVLETDLDSMDVIGRAGTLIARDGRHEIRTPYDGCVLVMPARRVRRGQTAVRLGRLVPDACRADR